MQTEESVFEETYKNYLGQLKELSFESIAPKLGAKMEKNTMNVAVYDSVYQVSPEKITGPSGKKPALDICVILSKYLLMCPKKTPEGDQWVSFRNFKDAGPLLTYFANDVENAIVSFFSGKLHDLKKASEQLHGYPPVIDADYDFSMQFDALPMIPVVLVFNDKDEDFPAGCSVLFDSRTDKYLDCECIAMLGRLLSGRLKRLADNWTFQIAF